MKRMHDRDDVANIAADVIESGEIDNAKPIYRHAILLVYTSESVRMLNLAFDLFTNSPTKIANQAALESLLNDIKTAIDGDIRLPATGSFMVSANSEPYIASVLYTDAAGLKTEGQRISTYGLNSLVISSLTYSVYDVVYKLN